MLKLKLFFTREKIKKKINSLVSERFQQRIPHHLIKFITNKKKIFIIIDLEKNTITPQIFQEVIKQLKQDKTFHDITMSAISAKKLSQEIIPNQQDKTQNKIPKIIAIASGKGGVGKSTIATNIAISLRRLGKEVGLIDADIYGPSIAHMMNLALNPKTENGFIIPTQSYGIKCISIGNMISESSSVPWRGPMIAKTLTQFVQKTKWNNVDYIIVDLPPGTGDVQLTMSQNIKLDGVVIVSTPQKVATIDAARAIDMFIKLNVPILGCVENMAFMQNGEEKKYPFAKDGVKKLCNKHGLNFLGEVEFHKKITNGGEEGKPICEADPSSKIAFSFGVIAEKMLPIS